LGFTYDALGYLATRSDYLAGRTESFIHDELGRLRHWYEPGQSWSVHYEYDDLGNPTSRSRVFEDQTSEATVFTPSPSRPHVLDSMVTGSDAAVAFTHDSLGRRTNVDGTAETVVYTGFDLPEVIQKGTGSWSFYYDAFHNRAYKDGPSGYTLYLGPLCERRVDFSTWQESLVMYIPGDDGRIIAQAQRNVASSSGTGSPTISYLHEDPLGSTTTITSGVDSAGYTRTSFEPFGSRVERSSPPMSRLTNDVPAITLGFTGHEQEDDLDLINMKGRIYDPTTMRFLSADRLDVRPLKSQGLNRYSYVSNSPLRWIDPTGFQQMELSNGGIYDGLTCRTGATVMTPAGRGSGSGGIDDQAGSHPQGTQNASSTGWYNGAGDRFEDTSILGKGTMLIAAAPMVIEAAVGAVVVAGTTAETVVATKLAPETIVAATSAIGALSGAAPEAPAASSTERAALQAVSSAEQAVVQATRGASQAERLVIGKVGDLTKAGALGQGERSLLSELSNLGSPKANWLQNSSKLREAMQAGSPIRDATVNESGALINNTGFLRAERTLLQSRGWTYDAASTSWYPPVR
jgi:RHS repeat-associated protein